MPYKSRLAKLEGTKHDKRVKLTKEQKQEIYEAYKTGMYSQRQLANMYGVSRRLITFCIDPEKLQKNLDNRKMRGGSKQYYDKEKNTAYMREHRNYKQKLFVDGLIKIEEK